MNRNRKSEIRDTIQTLMRCSSTLENIKDDEEDYYNNIPENLKESERAEESDHALMFLELALDEILFSIDDLEEIVECEVI